MSYKNVIGYCLVAIVVLFCIAGIFADAFKDHGWWAIVITPAVILGMVAFWSLIFLLLD